MITTISRPKLLQQSLDSIVHNASHLRHHITVVIDGFKNYYEHGPSGHIDFSPEVAIRIREQVGASRARNIGAGSIPVHARQEHVLFVDDDVWMAPGWDTALEKVMKVHWHSICSPYGHPFNQEEDKHFKDAQFPLVISSVAMAMPWKLFDQFGPWDEPGGPGASEDYALCMRAKKLEVSFVVTKPHYCLHTGLTSSKGEPIVGADQEREQNEKLLEFYGMQGKVIFQ